MMNAHVLMSWKSFPSLRLSLNQIYKLFPIDIDGMMPQHFVRCPAVRGSHSFNSQHRDESWRTFLLPPLLPVFYCTGRLKLEKISFFSDMCCFYAAVYLYRIYIQIPAKFFYFLSFLKEIFFCFTLENMFVPITL